MNALFFRRAAAALAACSLFVPVLAASPGDVLVRSPEMVITRADWEAELMRIPDEQRVAFTASTQRVQLALRNLLVNRTLAVRARAKGLDKDPVMERRLALEAERLLATVMVEQTDAEAAAEFDRMKERNIARARELYLVNQAKYAVPEEIEVTHILFDTTKKAKDAALASAVDARARIVAGADFGALARERSDDPSASRNNGRLAGITRGKTDPAFEQAAFALKNPGDVSEPVLSRFGYHVIRLEGRKPERMQTFAEAQPQILAEMREKHIAATREAVIGGIRGDSRIEVSQEAVEALVTKVEVPPLPSSRTPKGAPAAPKAK